MSNAPQTGRLTGVDILARMPDAKILIVDDIALDDARAMFPQFATLGVIGIPKPFEAIGARSTLVWSEYATSVASGLQLAVGSIVKPGRHLLSFLGDRTAAVAFLGEPGTITRYVPIAKEPETPQIASGAVDEPSLPPGVDEHSLADSFSRQNPGLRYVHAWGKWFEWSGARWLQDDTLRAYDIARAICVSTSETALDLKPPEKKKLKSAQTRAAVENLARSDRRHAATVDQWDRDTWLLNTPGGIVDLRTGELRSALQDDYCTKMTKVAPGGDCPQWLQFLKQVTDFDDELASFLQRVIGYSLTGDIREHALFFLYGTGANGKGTFLNTITSILADYATIAGTDVFTESKHDRHPQELARLRGARMVCAQETEEGKRMAEARIKALTGGDPITAHFMRQDDFTFQPQFKLVIAGNHKPILRNIDEAMRRRLHLIPFTITIAPEKRDKMLAEKLAAEAGGILQWAIDGCMQWQKSGLQPPEVVRKATEDYMNSQDQFALWMDECTRKNSEKTRTSELFKSFKAWAEGRGEFAPGQGRFNEMLTHRGHDIRKINGIPFGIGLSLKAETYVTD